MAEDSSKQGALLFIKTPAYFFSNSKPSEGLATRPNLRTGLAFYMRVRYNIGLDNKGIGVCSRFPCFLKFPYPTLYDQQDHALTT